MGLSASLAGGGMAPDMSEHVRVAGKKSIWGLRYRSWRRGESKFGSSFVWMVEKFPTLNCN